MCGGGWAGPGDAEWEWDWQMGGREGDGAAAGMHCTALIDLAACFRRRLGLGLGWDGDGKW